MASVPDFVRPYPGGWQDFSEGETPITAEILNETYDEWLAAVSGWINGAEPRIERIPDELVELTGDVLITNPANGQVLKYNATTHMWYNGTDESGSTVTFSQIQGSGTKIATITIDGTSYDIYAPSGGGGGGDTVTWTQIQATGTKIATITINGTSTDVYTPTGGSGGGDSVSYTQIVQSGTKIGTITINNVATDIYVPTVPTKTSDLTNDSNFVSDASYVHTDNNYTTTEKNKLGDLVQVVANPSSGTSAGDLSSISIGGTKYDIPSGGGGGTTVVANPSGEATVELEKLQVGSTIYSIPEGGSGGDSDYIDVVGKLTAGNTSITLSSPKIKTSSCVFPWTSVFGLAPTSMSVQNGSVTLVFPPQQSDVDVMVRVTKLNTGHVYDIDLSTLQANKSWFYYDAVLSSVNDTGDGLQLSGNDTRNDWTTSATVGINIANMIGTIPVGLTALKLHFKTFEMEGYTGVRFINSNTLYTGQAGGSDAMLKTNGFYQFENNNSTIDEDNYELTIPCTASNLANDYLYIMFFDGMIAGNTSNYNNGLNGAYNIIIDGIDYVTGGNS